MSLHLLKDPQPLQRVYQYRPSNHKNILPQTTNIVLVFSLDLSFLLYFFSCFDFEFILRLVHTRITCSLIVIASDLTPLFCSFLQKPLFCSFLQKISCTYWWIRVVKFVQICFVWESLSLTRIISITMVLDQYVEVLQASFVCIHLKTMTVPAPEFSRQDRALRASPHWAMIACWQA